MRTLVHRKASVDILKPVTKQMIRKWDMKDVDWMGYKKGKNDIYNFHHLIIPARNGGPYEEWNGAILNGSTSHPYLHVIENIDYEMFCYITSLLIDENVLGKLDLQIIKEIDATLKSFERQHQGERYKSKKRIIKPEYTIRDYTSLK